MSPEAAELDAAFRASLWKRRKPTRYRCSVCPMRTTPVMARKHDFYCHHCKAPLRARGKR